MEISQSTRRIVAVVLLVSTSLAGTLATTTPKTYSKSLQSTTPLYSFTEQSTTPLYGITEQSTTPMTITGSTSPIENTTEDATIPSTESTSHIIGNTTEEITMSTEVVTIPDTGSTSPIESTTEVVTISDTGSTSPIESTTEVVTIPDTGSTSPIECTTEVVTIPDTGSTSPIESTTEVVTIPDTGSTSPIESTTEVVTIPNTGSTSPIESTTEVVTIPNTGSTSPIESTTEVVTIPNTGSTSPIKTTIEQESTISTIRSMENGTQSSNPSTIAVQSTVRTPVRITHRRTTVAEKTTSTGFTGTHKPFSKNETIKTELTSTTIKPTAFGSSCQNITAPNEETLVPDTVYSRQTVDVTCKEGYTVSGQGKVTCLLNGSLSDHLPFCIRIQCKTLEDPENGKAIQSIRWYKSITKYSCSDGYVLQGYVERSCQVDGQWSGEAPTCKQEEIKTAACPIDTDFRNGQWNKTQPGQIIIKKCKQDFVGEISRKCDIDGKWLLPRYNCTSAKVLQVADQFKDVGAADLSEEKVTQALVTLADVTVTNTSSGQGLQDGDLQKVASVLDKIADIATLNRTVSDNQTENFLAVASNLLDESNSHTWQAVSQTTPEEHDSGPKASSVLKAIESFTGAVSQQLSAVNGSKVITKPNIVIKIAKISKTEPIHFPDTSKGSAPSWVSDSSSGLQLQSDTLKSMKSTSYSSAMYRNLSGILTHKDSSQKLNSPVLSFQLHPKPTRFLEPPITLQFQSLQNGYINPECSYWDFESATWSSKGCHLSSTNGSITVCECTHLTNFAILMSPWVKTNVDTKALDIISIVGCSVSVLGLIVTCIAHIALWRYVKSDRVIVLLNLCVALLASYLIFMLGVDHTENKDLCTSIAALLQYIYLVVFFLMLAEGVEIGFTILSVFPSRSRIKWLLPLAWGIPIVIVGISLGVTRLKGYGTDQFCWLSVDNGLIWSFVGPAFTIILVNMVLLILVIRAMFNATTLKQKSNAGKIQSGVRSLCVLLPIMGVTWVIGIFYVNSDSAWIQYVFAVCNGLQGFFIFLFHCGLNRQLRRGVNRVIERSRSVSSSSRYLKTSSSYARKSRNSRSNSSTGSNNEGGFQMYSGNKAMEMY